MKVRGERECTDCGARWSYYETGSVACPECESLHSVGIADRKLHTDAAVDLDLTPFRDRFGEARGTLPEEGVDDLKQQLRAYVRKRGFVHGGELRPLDDTYLAARELLQAVDLYDRLPDPTDDDRLYLLELLAGADEGDRPDPGAVPDSSRQARGLAYANAVATYRDDLLTYLDDIARGGTESDAGVTDGSSEPLPVDPAEVREHLGAIRDRVKRIEALQGDVDPVAVEELVRAVDDVGRAVREDDPQALDAARDRIAGSEL